MANLTITVDDDLLRRARARAVEQGTSVNAVLREELSRYVEASGGDRAADAFLAFARTSAGSGGLEGRMWRRDRLHADRG
jgi:plasmid stability protein